MAEVCMCMEIDNDEKKDVQMSKGMQRVRQELDNMQHMMLQK